MRVLYIAHCPDLAGANRSLLQMVIELRAHHGVEPVILFPDCGNEGPSIKTVCETESIPYVEHRIENFKKPEDCSFLTKVKFVIKQTYCVSHLLWLLRKEHFDIIHTNTSVNDTGAYLSTLKRTKHVWHLREFGYDDFGLVSCLGKHYEKWIYTKCDKFIAISDVIKAQASDVIDSGRIDRVYNGIKMPDAGLMSHHASDKFNICVVGRVEPKKNQFEALKAVKQLIEKGVTQLHLYIIGKEDKQYKNELLAFISVNNLSDYCTFTGELSDVPSFLSNMDIGLMTSEREAFGRVTVEYMLQNLAVVASNTGANREIINDGVDGLIYKLGDINDFAVKLESLISDREYLRSIANKGEMKAKAEFSSKANSDGVYTVYEIITNKKQLTNRIMNKKFTPPPDENS